MPFCYIKQENYFPYNTTRPDFIKRSIFGVPLNGEAYNLDNKEVAVIVYILLVNNMQAYNKIHFYRT